MTIIKRIVRFALELYGLISLCLVLLLVFSKTGAIDVVAILGISLIVFVAFWAMDI